ncbi:MAG TPA: class F sortase [Sporichthya sp.]|nr:class F sortase [Sporichthya sp.]
MSGAGAEPGPEEGTRLQIRDQRTDRVTLVVLALAATLACGGLAAIAAGHGPTEASSNAPRPALTIDDAQVLPPDGGPLVAPAAYAPEPPGEVPVLRRSEPTHLLISRVGINTDVMDLGLNPDGTVQVPPDTEDAPAGWYRNLATPGENGPAVILGHLDSPDDKGVFFNLGAVREGDTIVVSRRDGSTATFTVDMVAAFSRGAFPTAGVYGATAHPALRLVTCGGKFSHTSGYEDSVVVFASLTGSRSFAQKPSYTWWR